MTTRTVVYSSCQCDQTPLPWSIDTPIWDACHCKLKYRITRESTQERHDVQVDMKVSTANMLVGECLDKCLQISGHRL